MLGSFHATVLRLAEAVEEENAALRQGSSISHAAYTERKNQALRDLMAAQRRDPGAAAFRESGTHLKRLAAALRDNARLLKIHIAAVGEVSDIIISGLREAESDGTYSRARLRV
jgi:hypothetical protein